MDKNSNNYCFFGITNKEYVTKCKFYIKVYKIILAKHNTIFQKGRYNYEKRRNFNSSFNRL